MFDIENNLPKFIQRKVHVKRAVVKPNEGTTSFVQKVTHVSQYLLLSLRPNLPVITFTERKEG